MNIFMTGSTGFIGKQYVVELLERDPTINIYCLIRKNTLTKLDQGRHVSPFNNERVHLVEGDLTSLDIESIAKKLPSIIDEFWHFAGTTDFNEEKRERIFKINLDGTANAIALAEQLNVGQFYHTSTAYVSGIFEGRVQEDTLLLNPVFRNPYEESKYEAEQLVRYSDLNWIILRPSIVMGNTVTGEADSDKTVYGMAKLYYMLYQLIHREWKDKGGIPEGLSYHLKANPKSTKNIIAVNELVRLMHLVREYGLANKTYHLTSERVSTMEGLHNTFINLIHHPIITLTDEELLNDDPLQLFLNQNVGIYKPYLYYNDPVFDRTNLNAFPGAKDSFDIDKDTLQFLMKTFLEKKQGKKTKDIHPGELDYSKFEDVQKWGVGSLSFDAMAKQFETFRDETVPGFISYVLFESTALMVIDPVSPDPCLLTKKFVQYCNANSFSACAIQVSEPIAETLRNEGLVVNGFGIDTYIDLDRFEISNSGKKYNKMRRHLSVALENDITIAEEELLPDNFVEMKIIHEQWRNKKANKNQLEVLVRPITFKVEKGSRSFMIRQRGEMIGYALFSPFYENKKVIGYYISVMQYLKDIDIVGAFNFTAYACINAMEAFKQEGVKYISLGMSPLYGIERAKWNDKKEVEDLLAKYYEDSILYAFKGVANQKKRIPDTDEKVMYMAVESGAATEDMLNILSVVGFIAA